MAILSVGALRHFTNSILDFFYPPVCLACRKLLMDGERHVCGPCWDSIEPIRRDLGLYQETRNKLCATGVIDELVAAFVFEKEGAFQHVAHALKYSGCRSLGVELGKRLGRVAIAWRIGGDYLVPVPLHRRKLRERGYNQAELIARGLSEVTNIPVRTDIVRRKKFTQTQTTLSFEDRKKNMGDAFEVQASDPWEIKGKTFILIDDIITTGATIESCGRALREAGASRLIAASAALAQ